MARCGRRGQRRQPSPRTLCCDDALFTPSAGEQALVISCSRSFAPMDHIFGADPRALLSVRVAGYTCSAADSVVGSVGSDPASADSGWELEERHCRHGGAARDGCRSLDWECANSFRSAHPLPPSLPSSVCARTQVASTRTVTFALHRRSGPPRAERAAGEAAERLQSPQPGDARGPRRDAAAAARDVRGGARDTTETRTRI